MSASGGKADSSFRSAAVVVRLAAVCGAVMMRGTVTMLSGLEVLLHHRPAVPVPHNLLVGHAVALADRPL
jgi:hypothetical protein